MKGYKGKRLHTWVKVLLALLLAVVVAFGALEAVVFSGARTQISGEPEIMVIFGCQVKPWGPSILLQDRLDTALDYLEDHPDMTVVVSGGQGDDEHISEAQCMYDYLTEHGVDGGQILLEDQSRNTRQNIENAAALLRDYPVERVLIVTSDYHLPRALALAKDQGLSASGIGSTTLPEYWIKNHFREALSWIKYWGQKYLRLPLD